MFSFSSFPIQKEGESGSILVSSRYRLFGRCFFAPGSVAKSKPSVSYTRFTSHIPDSTWRGSPPPARPYLTHVTAALPPFRGLSEGRRGRHHGHGR